ncbi:2329_t:CDS:2, partial [Racocetra persica]
MGTQVDHKRAKKWAEEHNLNRKRAVPSTNQNSLVKQTRINDYFPIQANSQDERTQHTSPHRIYSLSSPWIQRDDMNHSGNILPDGTKLTRPLSLSDFISLNDNENDNKLIEEEEKVPTFENIFKMLKNKVKLMAEEKATLRYGMSRIINLPAYMRVWFPENECQDIMKLCEEDLK